jgi:hypothetical protein
MVLLSAVGMVKQKSHPEKMQIKVIIGKKFLLFIFRYFLTRDNF